MAPLPPNTPPPPHQINQHPHIHPPHNVEAMMAECALDVCYGCMEKNKKSPRWGGEGWRPFVCVMPKSNGKQAPPLSFAITPTVTRKARHSPPSPLRKKSRLRRKKTCLPQKKLQHRMGGMPLPLPLPLPPSPPPTQCYPLYSFYSFYSFYSLYSPPHSTIRQRIKCRGAIFCARPSMPPPPGCIHYPFPIS